MSFQLVNTSNLDHITVANPGGLTLNGGSFDILNSSGSQFGTNGTYSLINYSGTLNGAATNLFVNSFDVTKKYVLSSTASAIQVTISDAVVNDWSNTSGNGLWTTGGGGGNWNGAAVPNAAGAIVRFGTLAGGGSVQLNGIKTVGGIAFDNSSSYILDAPGSTNTLTIDNGSQSAVITDVNGSHTINAPVQFNSNAAIGVGTVGTSLTINGVISALNASIPLTIAGSGSVTFGGTNTYGGTTTVKAGATSTSVAAGPMAPSALARFTLVDNAAVNFNRSSAYPYAGAITGTGSGVTTVNQIGTGATTLSGPIGGITSLNVSNGSLTTSNTVVQSGGINVTGVGGLGNQGAGSYTAGGVISGSGGLNVDTTGTVTLNQANNFTGGTTINSGTVVMGANNAIPSIGLGVNGGTLNLNGFGLTINNITDQASSTGVITNNSTANNSTFTFAGNNASYNIYAALNNGSGGKTLAVSTGIGNTQSGNVRVLEFHTAGTYSGGTNITSQSVRADVSGAFGTGTITVNSTANTTNSSQILIAPGVTVANNITVSADNPHPVNTSGPFGVIQPTDLTDTGSDVVLTGTITVSNTTTGTAGTGLGGDGLFNGPTGNTFLDVNGKVTVGGNVTTIVQIGGNVKYGNATSSYGTIMVNGLAKLGITNGLATNSVLTLSQVALSGATGSGARHPFTRHNRSGRV